MKKLILSTLILFSLSTFAQEINGGPINSRTQTGIIDGVYLKSHIPTKRLIPYPPVREADVMWSKRVWRTLDLREKLNIPIYYPLDEFSNVPDENGEFEWIRNEDRWSLWTVIRQHILSGDLTVYSEYNPIKNSVRDGDMFKYPILPEPGKSYLTDPKYREDLLWYLADVGATPTNAYQDQWGEDSVDVDGNLVFPDPEITWVESKDIIEYRLKEDWFFDKQRSVLDVRIIGLAPVRYRKDDDGNIEGKEVMFWLYFPTDCRYVFNNYFSYNEKNSAGWISYDDFFMKRRFGSYIYKEENNYDRNIEKYRVGVDALRESERITDEIRWIEHDVWQY